MKDRTPSQKSRDTVLFVFSGYGSQWRTMGSRLSHSSPVFKEALQRCSRTFAPLSGWSIEEEIMRDKEHSQIEKVHIAPFCIFAVQYALVEMLGHWGITPSAVMGHSMGEISAACCAGVLTMEEALTVIGAVNGLIDGARGKGQMAQISLPVEELEQIIAQLNVPLFIAAINSPLSTVVAGEEEHLRRLTDLLESREIFHRMLKNDAPLHTPLMGEEKSPDESVSPLPPKLPVYSTLFGRKAAAGDFTAGYWHVQARKPILFTKALDAAIEEGHRIFIEIAPHPVLTGLMEECFQKHGGSGLHALGTLRREQDETEELMRLLSALTLAGAGFDMDALSKNEKEILSRIAPSAAAPSRSRIHTADSLKSLIIDGVAEIAGRRITDESAGFFQMGLDSLGSIRLKDYLCSALGIRLPGTVAFDYPTVEALSRFLDHKISGTAGEKTDSPARAASHEPLAIIGMGCRFPGGAENPESFWELLQSGRDGVTEIPADRWDKNLYYDPDPEVPGKMFTTKGGFLKGNVYDFDAPFFAISPKEAQSMDPQHRLLLEVCWEALENAGIDPASLKESRTGVYVGISCDDYEAAHRHSGDLSRIDAYSITGSTFSIVAGRISYFLGLQGPAFIVDTACSSTLVALHCACQSLRAGESNLAIVGGVNLILSPEVYVCFTKLRALSPDGGCRTFDASANGYCRGEGCGIVIVKRLSDALRDRDRILAVVKGEALNQDGRSTGITAPNGLAQQKVIRLALDDAGIEPSDVDYIEAHGTGTPLGDPIEVEAIGAAMKERQGANLLLGSVKSNIGHLESAAGSAGLLKIILSLQHEAIPANLHFRNPNPYISWNDIPVEVVSRMKAWTRSRRPRIAGISAFGFSGTNAHIILEEAPELPVRDPEMERPCHILTLSARSEKALMDQIDRYSNHLAHSSDSPADICHTAAAGRAHFDFRAFAAGEDSGELKSALAAMKEEKAWGKPCDCSNSIAFLFSGQGSQYQGMGKMLYDSAPAFRKAMDRCDELFRPLTGQSILAVINDDRGDESPLHQTEFTQPALFTIEYALLMLWKSWGIEPGAVLGHSIGEYAAACAAGVFTLEDAAKLVAARGKLMQALKVPGLMASLSAAEQEVIELTGPYEKSVSIAAVNGPESVVISGEKAVIEKIVGEFQSQGRRARLLKVSHAFHSPLMDAILDEFEHIASTITLCAPRIPLISNLTGKPVKAEDITKPSYWREHIRRAVRFHDSMKTLQDMNFDIFLELGGDSTLSSLAMQCLDQGSPLVLPSLKKGKDDWRTLLGTLGSLYIRGISIDWQQFDEPYDRRKVTLPTYPFQKKRYYINPVREPQGGADSGIAARENCHPFLGQRIVSPALKNDVLFQTVFSEEKPQFLQEHMMFGATVSPGAAHLSMMLSALRFHYRKGTGILEEVSFLKPLVVTENEKRTVQMILEPGERNRATITSATEGSMQWDTHCTGFISDTRQEPGRTTAISLGELKARCTETIDMEELYGRLKKIGCNLGPEFRSIEELYFSSSDFLGLLRKKKNPAAATVYEITPGLIDSILQVMLLSSAWAIRKVGENESLFIPFHVGKLVVHNMKLPDEFWCHCTFRETQETVTGDLAVFDEKGSLYLEIYDLIAKFTDRQVFLKGSRKSYLNVLYGENWIEEAPGPSEPSAVAHYLVFSDRQGMAEKIFEQSSFTSVTAGKEFQSAQGAFQINPESKEDFSRLFRETAAQGGRDLKIVFMWPLDADSSESLSTSELENEQAMTCGSLLNLLQALGALNLSSPPAVHIITGRARKVTSGEELKAFAQTPIWGFGRTASQELPHIWGGMIDIDENVQPSEVLRELSLQDGETLVALREGGRRYVARLEKETLPPSTGPSSFRAESTCLITGGLGALGLTLASWLSRKGCRHIAVTSRDISSPAKKAVIEKLRALDASIEIVEGDVSSFDDAARMISVIESSAAPLSAVFHLAGMLDDGMIEEQNWARFSRVMKPKVSGAWNLHRLTRDIPLDYFVLYSSASSLLGNPGQSNYAAGNAFLEGLAEYRAGKGLPALSINWSSWADGGMAAGKGQDRLAHYGVRHLKADFGLEVLDMLLSSGNSRAAVIDIDWATYRDRLEQKQSRYLGTMLPGKGEKTEESEGSGESILSILEATPSPKRKEALVQYLQTWSARIMGFDDPGQVKTDLPLMDQGVDSLMIVEMRNKFNREVKTTLPMTLLFNYPTLKKLAEFMLAEILNFPDREGVKKPASTDEILGEIEALVTKS